MALSLTGHDSIQALVPLLMASDSAYGLVGPNATHEALQPMPQAAGIASAVLRRIQMVAGAVASALVPALYHGHSSLPMTGVMAGCAITALLIYLLGLRHAEQVVTGASASPAE